MFLPPILKSERLRFIPLNKTHAGDIFEYARIPEVALYTTWNVHETIADTVNYIEYSIAQAQNGVAFDWAISLKETKKVIGTVGLIHLNDPEGTEIGYVISPQYWSKGFAFEAASEILNFGFRSLHLQKIHARIFPQNAPSIRVAEKLGMKLVREIPGKEYLYVLEKPTHT